MGAGCYYTHNCNKEKAAWIDIVRSEDDDPDFDDALDFIKEDLEQALTSIGWSKTNRYEYRNGLFKLILDSTHYGDGLILRIEPLEDYGNLYNLAMANHHRTEKKVWKAVKKLGYTLRIATSGYTSTEVIIEE